MLIDAILAAVIITWPMAAAIHIYFEVWQRRHEIDDDLRKWIDGH